MGSPGQYDVPAKFATAGLILVVLPPSLCIFFLGMAYVPRRIDWAKSCYTYFLPALGLFNFACLLNMVTFCIMGVNPFIYERAHGSEINARATEKLGLAYSYLHLVARFFDCITDMFVFLCLNSLSVGLTVARTGFPGSLNKIVKAASYILALILSVLASVALGLFLWVQISMRGDFLNDDPLMEAREDNRYRYLSNHDYHPMAWQILDYLDMHTRAMKLNYVFVFVIWVLSLALAGRSILLLVRNSRERRIQMATRVFAACTMLWLLRTTFSFAMEITDKLLDNWRHGQGSETVYNIVNVPLSTWSLFAVFTLLYLLGRHKGNGLFLPRTDSATVQKNLQVNQADKGFQDIEIPMYPVHTQSGLSSHGQTDSPSSPQASPNGRPPFNSAFTDSIEPVVQTPERAYEPGTPLRIQTRARAHNAAYSPHRRADDQDWVRPPSVDPPPLFSQRNSLRTLSPPPHDELMGLNHQADGYTPSAPLPYKQ